eukprot:COSAG01_NODE_43966_length_424_cov_0.760000_1_plen_102_part_10
MLLLRLILACKHVLYRGPDSTHGPYCRRHRGVDACRAQRDGAAAKIQWSDHGHHRSPIHPVHLRKLGRAGRFCQLSGAFSSVERDLTSAIPLSVKMRMSSAA